MVTNYTIAAINSFLKADFFLTISNKFTFKISNCSRKIIILPENGAKACCFVHILRYIACLAHIDQACRQINDRQKYIELEPSYLCQSNNKLWQ